MKYILPLILITLFLVGCSGPGPDDAGYLPADERTGFLYFFTEG